MKLHHILYEYSHLRLNIEIKKYWLSSSFLILGAAGNLRGCWEDKNLGIMGLQCSYKKSEEILRKEIMSRVRNFHNHAYTVTVAA